MSTASPDSSTVLPLTGLLRELDKDPREASPEELALVPSDEAEKVRKLRVMSDSEKRAEAFLMRMDGVPVNAIAKGFGVSTSTVYRWLHEHADEFRTHFEQRPAANVIVEHMQWLGRLEEMCLYEANQLKDDGTIIDPKTGTVTRIDNGRAKSMKNKFLQSAMRARRMMIELQLDTGVLPREPSKHYHSMVNDGRAADEEKTAHRTPEQVREEILKLAETTRTL